jgi:response regulator RpfG family c-di-GMP phosphodiesterase
MDNNPVLILMFVCLSYGFVYKFSNKITHDPETGSIRVIMMSGEDCNQKMITYANADDFMQKPFDYNDLVTRVQQHFSFAQKISA